MKFYSSHKSSRGFSLSELIVVLAIIAILAGLAFPVIGKASARAKSAECLNNLRQWGVALNSYLDEHKGRFPSCPEGKLPAVETPSDWFNALPPYMNIPTMIEMHDNSRIPHPGGGQKSFFLCPADVIRSDFDDDGSIPNTYYSSYTFNSILSRSGARISTIKHSDVFVVMAEAADGETSGITANALMDEEFNAFRHSKTTNFLFADGHAQNVSIDNVWKDGLGEEENYGPYKWNPKNYN